MVHFVSKIDLTSSDFLATTLSQVKASFFHVFTTTTWWSYTFPHLIILSSSSSLKAEGQSVSQSVSQSVILYLPQDPSYSFRTSLQCAATATAPREIEEEDESSFLHSFIHSNRRKNPPPMICCEEFSLRERNICHSSREMFPHFDHKSLGSGSIAGWPHVSHHQSSWIHTAANMQIRGLSLEESLLFSCPLNCCSAIPFSAHRYEAPVGSLAPP
jgi:hypothetical protein